MIAIISSLTLEAWSWKNPKEKGIGGSETSHIYMCEELAKAGFEVVSYAPIPEDCESIGPAGVKWLSCEDKSYQDAKVVIIYRDPKLLDFQKKPGQKIWFVAQDVSYPFTQEQLDKIDRYLVLCPTHASVTRQLHPELHSSGRLFLSSNGIDSAGIRQVLGEGIIRNPKRIQFASSPDRGLVILLENWFRIRERVPDAELHFFYGRDNMRRIVEINGPTDWRFEYMKCLVDLANQPGIVDHGRIGQVELWRNWAASNVWAHLTDFPETSCLTCMEAQALGAIPVTNRLWALKYNVDSGYLFSGIPQKDPVVRQLMIERVIALLNDSSEWDTQYPGSDDVYTLREDMQNQALARFDWRNVAEQWGRWIEEDFKSDIVAAVPSKGEIRVEQLRLPFDDAATPETPEFGEDY